MAKTILYIDGQSFFHYLERTLKKAGVQFDSFTQLPHFRFDRLFGVALASYNIDDTKFFTASIKEYVESPAHTPGLKAALAERDLRLRNNIQRRGWIWRQTGILLRDKNSKVCRQCFIPLNLCPSCKNLKLFEEKGVDTGLVMDLTLDASQGNLDTALVLSSDTDMIPAMRFAMLRGVKVVHVGFHKPFNIWHLRQPDVCAETVELPAELLIEAFQVGAIGRGQRRPSRVPNID